jgi:hypothetical protein
MREEGQSTSRGLRFNAISTNSNVQTRDSPSQDRNSSEFTLTFIKWLWKQLMMIVEVNSNVNSWRDLGRMRKFHRSRMEVLSSMCVICTGNHLAPEYAVASQIDSRDDEWTMRIAWQVNPNHSVSQSVSFDLLSRTKTYWEDYGCHHRELSCVYDPLQHITYLFTTATTTYVSQGLSAGRHLESRIMSQRKI